MSNFYASIQGSKGEATRTGHGAISGHIRSQKLGVRVEGFQDGDGKNVFHVFKTNGSAGGKSELIAEIEEG